MLVAKNLTKTFTIYNPIINTEQNTSSKCELLHSEWNAVLMQEAQTWLLCELQEDATRAATIASSRVGFGVCGTRSFGKFHDVLVTNLSGQPSMRRDMMIQASEHVNM